MGKSTKKKNKKITAPKANIQELSISRDGGHLLGIGLFMISINLFHICHLRRLKNLYLLLKLKKP